jgi:hypothetical protein
MGTDNHLNVLDLDSGSSVFAGPISVTSQNAFSLAANGDLYFAWSDLNPQT